MYLITDLTKNTPYAVTTESKKMIRSTIINITGSSKTGDTVQAIANHMRPGDSYVSNSHFQVQCISTEDGKNIMAAAVALLEKSTSSYTLRIWSIIGATVIYYVLLRTHNLQNGFTEKDVSEAIGQALFDRLDTMTEGACHA